MVSERGISGGVSIPLSQSSDERKRVAMNLYDWGEVVVAVKGRFIEKIGVVLGKFGQNMTKRYETVEDASGLRPK